MVVDIPKKCGILFFIQHANHPCHLSSSPPQCRHLQARHPCHVRYPSPSLHTTRLSLWSWCHSQFLSWQDRQETPRPTSTADEFPCRLRHALLPCHFPLLLCCWAHLAPSSLHYHNPSTLSLVVRRSDLLCSRSINESPHPSANHRRRHPRVIFLILLVVLRRASGVHKANTTGRGAYVVV